MTNLAGINITASVMPEQSALLTPHGVMDNGRKVTLELVRAMIPEILAGIIAGVQNKIFVEGDYEKAAAMFEELLSIEPMVEFLTNYCYDVMD